MRQRIGNGSIIDTVTPGELKAEIAKLNGGEQVTRIRAHSTLALTAAGSGTVGVYKVPMGYEFSVRRVSLGFNLASDPFTGNVVFGPGVFITYRRSDQFIEYAITLAPTAQAQVPGVQTWSDHEGPYLRNGEVFQVEANGLTANGSLTVMVEGQLKRPAKVSDD